MSDSSRLRVVFMGTSEFAVPSLRRLADAMHVCGVVTQPDRPRGRGRRPGASPIKLVAQELGLDPDQPEKARSEAVVTGLRRLSPDVIAVVAYGQLLARELLDLAPLGCVNLHPSVLPKYRGAAPIQWAVWNGEAETGITVIRLDEGEDSGPIFRQVRVGIDGDETAADLHERLAALGSDLLIEVLSELRDGTLEARPQEHAQATRAPRLTREMGDVDWTLPARTIYNHYRACVPWPGTTARWPDGKRLRIVQCRPAAGEAVSEPGAVHVADGRPLVDTGEGRLELTEVQPENRAAVTADAYVNGLRGVAPPAFAVGPAGNQDTDG